MPPRRRQALPMPSQALLDDLDLLRVRPAPAPTRIPGRENLKIRNDLNACHKACISRSQQIASDGPRRRHTQKSQLAEDIRYTLAHWTGLIRFLEDGTLELDNNPVENQIRPIALTRKNALFAGTEIGAENWPMLASLMPPARWPT